jgi:hypothetical protein
MAKLAPSQIAVQILGRQLESRRKALDDSGQPRAMGFPSGRNADASHAPESTSALPRPANGAARATD